MHIVSDKYDTLNSIKASECKKHGSIAGSPEVLLFILSSKFYSEIRCFWLILKTRIILITSSFQNGKIPCCKKIRESQVLVLAGGFQNQERVVAISRNHVEVVEVYFNYEEADTRLILHIQCFIECFGTRHIVWSPDTDVMILGVYFSHKLDIDIWFRTGRKEKVNYIPLHGILSDLGQELTATLLAFHAIIGCDSTSCFKGRGKERSLLVLKSSAEEFHILRNLEISFL